MSQNKYMHPRNIYRTPPNFKELAITYPEFRKYAKQDISGKVTIDFKDQEALRSLTTTLLKKDFGLQVEIPTCRLVPTLPLRLNYLLWIEDIMQLINTPPEKEILGVDIGTGASCIYPLLAAKTKKWKMIGTEVDLESINHARKNIESNGLENFVTVKHVEAGTILSGVLDTSVQYDFTMCNPPFFSNEKEADSSTKSRSEARPLPHNVKTGSLSEVVTEGGEKTFIMQMIKESAELKNTVRVYSTMMGQKSSLKHLKLELEKIGVQSSTLTEFCQGHTTRWGLAWTFAHECDLVVVPRNKKKKDKPPLTYIVPAPEDNTLYTVNTVVNKLKQLFIQLEINFKDLKANQKLSVLEIIAEKNTWSKQRRKRREQKSQEVTSSQLADLKEKTQVEMLDTSSKHSSELKRKLELEEDAESSSYKKTKPDKFKETPSQESSFSKDDTESASTSTKNFEGECANENNQESFVLKSVVSVRKVNSEIHIEMAWLEGNSGRDAVHQILQYIKNNFKF